MTAMRLVNLCSHPINFSNGITLPPCEKGAEARVSVSREPGPMVGGVPTFVPLYGQVMGLPAPADGVTYVVSGLVRGRVPERADVASPGQLVRDVDGKVIGADGLDLNP